MLSDSWNSYQAELQEAWSQRTPQRFLEDSALLPMLNHHFQVAGKYLRPMLAVSFYDLLKGTNTGSRPQAVVEVALAIELLHNATLVHDDLQDGDETRRGQPTVWKKFDAYQAINAGSALYFYSLQAVAALELGVETRQRLQRLMIDQTLQIIEGQALEKDLWSRLDQSTTYEQALELYRAVVENKTSALFVMPLGAAAILAGLDDATVESLTSMARPLGTLFQIQDDLVDLYGNKGRDEPGMDIAEGKPSMLALYALHRAEPEQQSWLRDILRKPRQETTSEDIDEVMRLYQRSGALDEALTTLDRLQWVALDEAGKLETGADSEAFKAYLQDVCALFLRPIRHLLAKEE
jgi:geranylgeranyl pyrophosphate synthase